METKNAIYKVDNGDGTFNEMHFKTNANQVFYNDGKTLQEKFDKKEVIWSGGYVFTEGHKAVLSKNIKDTENGVILRWSAYTAGVIRDYSYCDTFLSKDERMFGKSQVLIMVDTGGRIVCKTVYIINNGKEIQGNNVNGNGDNHNMVLREVIAV